MINKITGNLEDQSAELELLEAAIPFQFSFSSIPCQAADSSLADVIPGDGPLLATQQFEKWYRLFVQIQVDTDNAQAQTESSHAALKSCFGSVWECLGSVTKEMSQTIAALASDVVAEQQLRSSYKQHLQDLPAAEVLKQAQSLVRKLNSDRDSW